MIQFGKQRVVHIGDGLQFHSRKGQVAAPFIGAYDAIPNLVHVYEPARCTLSAYTGNPLVRLRRASDDAESDFSHVSASDPELDLAAIAAWAGGAAYIVTVYDHVTGDDIGQATEANQPLFVASIQNGHAGARLDGVNHFLSGAYTTGGALSQPFSIYALASLDATYVNDNAGHMLVDGDDTTNRATLFENQGTNPDSFALYAGTVLSDNAADAVLRLWSALFNGASSALWLNAVLAASGNANTRNPDGITIGRYSGGGYLWKGDIMSVVVADPSHSDAQRGAMQTAINSYWSVY